MISTSSKHRAHHPLSFLALLAALAVPPLAAQVAVRVADLDSRTAAATSEQSLGAFSTTHGRATFAVGRADSVSLWSTDGSDLGTKPLAPLCASPSCAGIHAFSGRALGLSLTWTADNYGTIMSPLWRSDGTPGGSYPLTGTLSALQLPEPFAAQDGLGRLVFSGCDAAGCALWSSDGTRAGTRKIHDGSFGGLVVAGKTVFAFGSSGRNIALYRSDGTPEGTFKLRDLPPGEFDWLLTPAGSRVFFMAGPDSGALWTSDGTREGTRFLERFGESGHEFIPRVTTYFKAIGEQALFIADGGSLAQLWKSDGTLAGTRPLTAFPHGINSLGPRNIAELGGQVFFVGDDGVTGPRLWHTGLSLDTTAPVTGCPGGCPNLPPETPLTVLGNRLVFAARDLAHGTELWSSDGTGAGTRVLRDLCAGPCDAAPFDLRTIGGTLYAGVAFADGHALVRSDGTAAGTVELARLAERTDASLDLALLGSNIVFPGFDPLHGEQPWISDGTPRGTRPITWLPAPAPSSNPDGLVALGGRLLFAAGDGTLDGERRLWASDGPTATPLTAPGALADPQGPRQLTIAGGLAYFLSSPAEGAPELWRSDGTAAGTFRVASFPGRSLRQLDAVAGRPLLLVAAQDGSEPAFALWSSDGTAAGTVQSVVLPASAVDIPYFWSTGDEILFPVEQEEGSELWESDGTETGTRLLVASDCLCDSAYTNPGPQMAVRYAGRIYFIKWGSAEDFAGPSLWSTDGTPAGTVRVLPHPSGPVVPRLYFPSNLFVFQGDLFFLALTPRVEGNSRPVLFRLHDGAAERLTDAGAIPYSSIDPQYAEAGDVFYFRAYEPEHGYELWRSDGTKGGTRRVRDIDPGPESSDPQGLTVLGGKVYFSAYDPGHGRELWVSDGTEEGTRRLQDIAPGLPSSSLDALRAAGGRLFFSADDGQTGRELWSLSPSTGCTPAPDRLCLGRLAVEALSYAANGTLRQLLAQPLPAAGTDATATGTFSFGDPANPEIAVKVVDPSSIEGAAGVYYGALTGEEIALTVTDTTTGAVRRYFKPRGAPGSVGEAEAFPSGPAGTPAVAASAGPEPKSEPVHVASAEVASKAACVAGPRLLCLQNGRFAVTLQAEGESSEAEAKPLAGDQAGLFVLQQVEGPSLGLKILDGRSVDGHFWLFFAGLTDRAYALTVTDTASGTSRTYRTTSGRFTARADLRSF